MSKDISRLERPGEIDKIQIFLVRNCRLVLLEFSISFQLSLLQMITILFFRFTSHQKHHTSILCPGELPVLLVSQIVARYWKGTGS
jgi:hypothetical protein